MSERGRQKRWVITPSATADDLSRLGVPSSLLAQLLWNRGIRTATEAQAFIDPRWEEHLHDPTQFRHMDGAIAAVFHALEARERITVHGDYDADGVTGSTVLISTVREIEALMHPGEDTRVDSYIPHREQEGYGLHRNTIDKLLARETRLVITVDCGIACVEEIALAHEKGLKTIVVDHHEFGETLPMGHLIHPGIPGETYPFSSLAAVGVSYKFATVLLARARERGLAIPEGAEKWLLDLVAIATVTDMVPLVGENRLLEIYGLRVLNKTRRIGLQALLRSAGVLGKPIDTETIGFTIGPRLNAAGRMDHASIALNLLLAQTQEEADVYARDVERCNRDRQEATKRMMVEAEAQFATQADAPMIVLWDESWSPSLVGLVAGRFLEKYWKPVIAIGSHNGTWIGSGRCMESFHITEAVRQAGEGILTRAGGHKQACGFALTDRDKITTFAERLRMHTTEHLTDEMRVPTLKIDAEIPLRHVTVDEAQRIDALQPFGEGNRRPVFCARRCVVASLDLMGATQKHLRLQLVDEDGRRVKMVGFNQSDRAEQVHAGSVIDIAFTFALNEWQGRTSSEGRIVDIAVH